MRRNKWFEFKQFRIEQQRTAMKVGTDGVLLGAWASVDHTSAILDAGTGTGLIALMLAQRCDALIDAVEIEANAAAEAELNFDQSPWKQRLKVFQADFTTFSCGRMQRYDLIVCNPPYFVDSLKTPDPMLALARHNITLTTDQLIKGSVRLLNDKGRLAIIIPSLSFDQFRETARLKGLYLKRQTNVITKTGNIAERVLLEVSLLPCYTLIDEIHIRTSSGQITDQFKKLTSPYYLNY
jgi:tRNA1Val (adenine37-N6)-methyltransferase